jgi:hypothetical protein
VPNPLNYGSADRQVGHCGAGSRGLPLGYIQFSFVKYQRLTIITLSNIRPSNRFLFNDVRDDHVFDMSREVTAGNQPLECGKVMFTFTGQHLRESFYD